MSACPRVKRDFTDSIRYATINTWFLSLVYWSVLFFSGSSLVRWPQCIRCRPVMIISSQDPIAPRSVSPRIIRRLKRVISVSDMRWLQYLCLSVNKANLMICWLMSSALRPWTLSSTYRLRKQPEHTVLFHCSMRFFDEIRIPRFIKCRDSCGSRHLVIVPSGNDVHPLPGQSIHYIWKGCLWG